MLNTQGEIKFSEHAVLYDMLIPADNKYRLIDELIDFSFIVISGFRLTRI